MKQRDERHGFTLLELLLSLGLLSILVLALVRLLDTSMNIWGGTESARDLMEMSSSVHERLAADLGSLESGAQGDLLGEWVSFDTDRDGVRGMLYPRLRMIRQVSAAELRRLQPGSAPDLRSLGLLETCWALLPSTGQSPDGRAVGVLWRGERLVSDVGTLSFFDEGFFSRTEKPLTGALNAVTGGVLWFSILYATQTTTLVDGWTLGRSLDDCAASWDAWRGARPDDLISDWNLPGAGMPGAGPAPLLPRRVRVELELERAVDLRRRTRLAADLDREALELRVQNELKLPRPGSMILVDEEWMKIRSITGTRVAVERALRETQPQNHAAGALIHHGARSVREIPMPLYREDWDL
jgi:prepilin-type N-terminal cleavage/methylation domain-containing protein